MRDKFHIDGHKMIFHPERTAQWLAAGDDWEKQKKVYPLYVEISSSGSCNHRCSFCAVDYLGYKQVYLKPEVLNATLKDMAEHGVKSVMFGGEGEPLLMKGVADCIVYARSVGLDVGITTNGTAITDSFLSTALSSVAWIKVSLNAGEAETYARVHGTHARDFERVFANLEKAVKFRAAHGLRTTLGAQAVLIPENLETMKELCARGKAVGLDYVVIKPYSQHLKSEATKERGYEHFDYARQAALAEELAHLNDDRFSVIYRSATMKFLEEPERYYSRCHATPNFWAYLMANGDLYGCSAHLLDERFRYGNVNEASFSEIWEGEARKKNAAFVRDELKIEECRKNCRMEHINRYLWDLKNPNPHVNFI